MRYKSIKLVVQNFLQTFLASGHAAMFLFFGKVTNPRTVDYWIATLRQTPRCPSGDSEMAAGAFWLSAGLVLARNPNNAPVTPIQALLIYLTSMLRQFQYKPRIPIKCLGGSHVRYPVREFPTRFDAGNGACGLGLACGRPGLHARRATSVYRRRVSLVQRRDSERRSRQGLPAQEQGAA